MGGLGHHPVHPYALQTAAFLCSLVLPSALLTLLGGAWWEQGRRSRPLEAERGPD